MTEQAQAEKVAGFTVPPVVKTVVVPCAPAKAFRVFTENVGDWWPLATHRVGPEPVTCAFESRVGGRIFERGRDGAESIWGRVLAWEPPRRVAFTWMVGRDEDTAQTIEVTFAAVDGGTEVRLVHSGWEKLGSLEAAQKMRTSYDQGWATVFERDYARYAASAA